MTNKPNCLTEALRQYQHNDGSGFVFGYDIETVDRIIASDKERIKLLEECMKYARTVMSVTVRSESISQVCHRSLTDEIARIDAALNKDQSQ